MSSAECMIVASIISIGDEVVCGLVPDTNASHLARKLEEMGAFVKKHSAVRDELAEIKNALTAAGESSDIVMVTGGLGPTADDLTREAMAELTGRELVVDERAEQKLREFFERRGRPLHSANLKQATMPEGAEPLLNDRGTAAGFSMKFKRADFFFMPGVPAEMVHMFDALVAPALKEKLSGCSRYTRSLIVMGVSESDLGAELGDLMERGRNPEVGTMAQTGQIRVRVTGRGGGGEDIRRLVDSTLETVRERLGVAVAAEDNVELQDKVVELLIKSGKKLAVAESCTGGMVSAALIDVPGVSGCFLEGVIAYSNEAKIRILGVPGEQIERHGAVSEEVAAAMARGLRENSGADMALAITGIAGPGGGTAEKPVGLVYIAVSDDNGEECARLLIPGQRGQVRERATKSALNMLRLRLMGVS